MQAEYPEDAHAFIAIMGATGTGKSTFIKYLTEDEKIIIGHKPDSQTFDVETYSYVDLESTTLVTLVDTPGFDDSREGITDTDILEKIATFLQIHGGRKLNGIIYMYRISDVRMGGMSRKNLKMFKELCGDDRLSNVRIVGTNWDRVSFDEGEEREDDLTKGPFKSLLAAGAKMARQNNRRASALTILSEIIPQRAVTLKITEEMNSGKTLAETSAGTVIAEEIVKLQQRHEKEMRELRRELEEAAEMKNEQLRAELVAEQRNLEEKIERAAHDRLRLQETRIAELQYVLEEQERQRKLDLEGNKQRQREREKMLAESFARLQEELKMLREKESELTRALELERARTKKSVARDRVVQRGDFGVYVARTLPPAEKGEEELEKELHQTRKRSSKIQSALEGKDRTSCVIC